MIAFLRRIVLPSTVIMLVVILVVALWEFGGALQADPFGTTYGTIIVSSPEVYSRERLVNDRFQEATWLASELHNIDNLYWGSEAFVSTTQQDSRKLGMDIGQAQPDGAKAPLSGSATPRDPASGSTPHLSSVDGRAQSSPIEFFRDRVAYREEVRAASLETQLDDRHDIAGNTLYRLKFSVTILPEQDTSAWALVHVELKGADAESKETYERWLKYYEDQLNKELDRASDSTRRYPEQFTGFSRYVTTALRREACPPHGNTRDTDCERKLEARTIARQVRSEDLDRNKYAAFDRDLHCNPPGASGAGLPPCTAKKLDVLGRCNSSFESAKDACGWGVDNYKQLDALLQEYRDVRYHAIAEGSRPRPRQFLREVTAEYLVWGLEEYCRQHPGPDLQHPGPDLWKADVVNCEIGMCRITLENAGDEAAHRFASDLRADQVFAYAVNPKESVQRIANLASSQRTRQLALRASLASEQVPASLGTLLEQSQKDDSLLHAIMRKPLIVGFAAPGAGSSRGAISEASKEPGEREPVKEDVATFGWIIGPRFDISEGSPPRFRHTASENDVSAIISAPSWWKSAAVKITTCWVDERQVRNMRSGGSGVDLYAECKYKGEEDPHIIRVPDSLSEIARKLELEVVRRPSVLTENLFSWTVQAGEPADFLIPGNHLWRSTVVTLNGTPADNITVLPDMKGIVAHFNKIASLAPGEGRAWLQLFTSEGNEPVAAVTVVERKPIPPSAPAGGSNGGAEKPSKEVKQ